MMIAHSRQQQCIYLLINLIAIASSVPTTTFNRQHFENAGRSPYLTHDIKHFDESATAMDMYKYIQKFGHFRNMLDRFSSKEHLRNVLNAMQKYGAILLTDEMTEEKIHNIYVPRCGNIDSVDDARFNETIHSDPAMLKRSKRFAIMTETKIHGRPSATHGIEVRWYLEERNHSMEQPQADHVRRVLAEAFKAWSTVANIDFREVYGAENSDLLVLFVSRRHKDNQPFDGIGGVLAHGFYPESGAQSYMAKNTGLHFDAEEPWTVAHNLDSRMVRVKDVAAHEIGHCLGFEHSSDKNALMYYLYNPYINLDKGLPADDILAVRSQYGSRGPVWGPYDVNAFNNFSKIVNNNKQTTPHVVSEPVLCRRANSSEYIPCQKQFPMAVA